MQQQRQNKPGSGVLFQARNRSSERSPSMRGTVTMPDGNEYEISAWSKESPNAGKYLSFSIDLSMTAEQKRAQWQQNGASNGQQAQGNGGGYQQPQGNGSYQQPQGGGGYQQPQGNGGYQQPQGNGGFQQAQATIEDEIPF